MYIVFCLWRICPNLSQLRILGRTPLYTGDQLVSEVATNTTHEKRERRRLIPSAGFEPAVSAIKWRPTALAESYIQCCQLRGCCNIG